MSTYLAKLRDPRWQKKRLQVLDSANWQCEMCGDNESTLNVHHKQYFKGRDPWEYDRDQLAALCEHCHLTAHENDLLLEVISRSPLDGPMNRNDLAFLIAGALGLDITPEFQAQTKMYRFGEEVAKVVRSGSQTTVEDV